MKIQNTTEATLLKRTRISEEKKSVVLYLDNSAA